MEKNEQSYAGNKGMRQGLMLFIILLQPILLLGSCSYISTNLFYEDPLTAIEHNNLGVAYEREGKYDLAKREYKMAIEKKKDFTVSIINLGNVYFTTGELDKAEKQYTRALETDPDNIDAANNLGNIYLKKEGDLQPAIKILSERMQSAEEMPEYYLDTLGRLYVESGNKEKGIELLKKACNKTGDKELRTSIKSYLEDLGSGSCE